MDELQARQTIDRITNDANELADCLKHAIQRGNKEYIRAENLQQMYNDMATAYKSVCEQLHQVRPDKPI